VGYASRASFPLLLTYFDKKKEEKFPSLPLPFILFGSLVVDDDSLTAAAAAATTTYC